MTFISDDTGSSNYYTAHWQRTWGEKDKIIIDIKPLLRFAAANINPETNPTNLDPNSTTNPNRPTDSNSNHSNADAMADPVFTEFTEAAKVHSNDDSISRHRLEPFNAFYLT